MSVPNMTIMSPTCLLLIWFVGKIYDKKENPIGKVTSGTQSPSLNKGIGLGYVNSDFSEIGEKLFIRIRDKFVPCTIVRVPFYRY